MVGRKRFAGAARLLAHPIYFTSTFAATFLPWINFLRNWVGATTAVGLLIGAGVVIGSCIPLAIKLCRYSLLCGEVRCALKRLPIDSDTLLIGAGGGSFKAIGMLLKAWEEELPHKPPPYSICVSLDLENAVTGFYPALDSLRFCLRPSVIIVLTDIGTGMTARRLKEWLASVDTVKEANFFSLIVSEAAASSGEWNGVYTLAVANRKSRQRSIIPWISTRDEH